MNKVPSRKTLALAFAALVVAGGGGVTIAAARGDAPSRSSFLDAVARHLGVSREELDDATKAAALEQVDAALEAGRISEEQTDALRSRIESGEGPRLFGRFFGGFHGGMHGFVAPLSAAAAYLDLDVEQLRERLRRGQSLADVAQTEDKSVDGLEEAILGDAEKRFDEAVDDGLLTEEQAARMLDRLQARIDAIVNGDFPRWRGRGGGPPVCPRP